MPEIMTLLFRNTARHEQYYFFQTIVNLHKKCGIAERVSALGCHATSQEFEFFTQASLGLQPQGNYVNKIQHGTVTKWKDYKILGVFTKQIQRNPSHQNAIHH
jgi:hypothetical protein